MDKAVQFEELLWELDFIEEAIRAFSTPRLTDKARPFTSMELLLHELLMLRHAEVVVELAKIEGNGGSGSVPLRSRAAS